MENAYYATSNLQSSDTVLCDCQVNICWKSTLTYYTTVTLEFRRDTFLCVNLTVVHGYWGLVT
uniref:Uncharacterized protein n=1 Tax=Arundo donax TaxID=35708 RepID=A0A0A9CE71_ARUDO